MNYLLGKLPTTTPGILYRHNNIHQEKKDHFFLCLSFKNKGSFPRNHLAVSPYLSLAKTAHQTQILQTIKRNKTTMIILT